MQNVLSDKSAFMKSAVRKHRVLKRVTNIWGKIIKKGYKFYAKAVCFYTWALRTSVFIK